jgi:hypothetical protein
METRLLAGRSVVQILVKARDFCLLQNVQPGSGTHQASSEVSTGVLSGVKVAYV